MKTSRDIFIGRKGRFIYSSERIEDWGAGFKAKI